ncbi:unnamed protein product [Adineta steineri]|uniref:Uncharacterized protein n=1 Tax=Adineta steineri TaxID=433720 RepID=A0A819T543_9BILA|nr:unnamed protein product [Adineta steineri]CAF4073994.1 unnamed protein product [Adineta steineri]
MPIQYSEWCKGRLCNKCGKCRDWYFTGDSAILKRMQGVSNWQSNDWQRWHDGKFWEKFKRRDGYKCTHNFTYLYSYADLLPRGYHNDNNRIDVGLVSRGILNNNNCKDAENHHFGTNRVGCYRFDKSDGRSRFSFDHAYSTVEDRCGVYDTRSFCVCVDNCRD